MSDAHADDDVDIKIPAGIGRPERFRSLATGEGCRHQPSVSVELDACYCVV